MSAARLVLMRHGRSLWNAEQRFTGWADVDLDHLGVCEAVAAAERLRTDGVRPTVVHSSKLVRAARTADIVVQTLGLVDVCVERSWRLNERHYGALQGMTLAEANRRFGSERVARWRRSAAARPPQPTDEGRPVRAESFADVVERVEPWWRFRVVPALQRGTTVLVVAHGTTVRALLRHVESLDNEAAARVEVPTGRPLVYEWLPGTTVDGLYRRLSGE
ncbi:2,3-bisphosphoglycerate-dependent phosphoglycerate mutase [Nocardioides halotolerans]|uniref:2,3-bisphosphoglycerate-dependent phosphoglycerate mutase n=1 Tax=Nocardioides halotolerans TaxID=433660 RepID=UPI000417A43E|nr:2,3-diphosphoglycerate-dependent phosphoglycerate mutase [Nocardioides halotolerans]